jgi:1-acyl-sn-glycerol-3-phosphate acyltransferase
MSGSLDKLTALGKERLGELKALADRLFEHMPPRDLATILFPPALGLDLLGGAISDTEIPDDTYDPAMPDRGMLDASLDLARWLSRHYFKTKIAGVENVPASGAALLVGNHSAGLMPLDALFAMNEIRDAHGPDRVVHALVHDFAYVSRVAARNARKMGILRAKRESALPAMADGRLVLVYPGGDQDAFRTFAERGRIVLAGRQGFVRLAMAAGVPIIPLVSVGLHESFMVLHKGEGLARALGLKKLFRTEVFPLGLSLPWGIAPAFFPFLPLPTSIEMRFCAPIAADGSPDDEAAVRAVYDRVEAAMQEAMDELNRNRIPLLGR